MSKPNIIIISKFQTRVIRIKKRIIRLLQQLERPYFDLWQIMGDTRLTSLAKCALDYRLHLNQKTLLQIVAAYLYYAQPALGLYKTSYDLLRDFGLPREKFMKILTFVKRSGIVSYEDRFVPLLDRSLRSDMSEVEIASRLNFYRETLAVLDKLLSATTRWNTPRIIFSTEELKRATHDILNNERSYFICHTNHCEIAALFILEKLLLPRHVEFLLQEWCQILFSRRVDSDGLVRQFVLVKKKSTRNAS